jgi:tetratricopeptide (TPR) repeat protein
MARGRIADYRLMEFPLSTAGRRWFVVAVSFAIAALVIFQASELWLASHRLDSKQIGQVERGVALVPGDGEAWDQLGRMRQWDFMNSDLPGAIEDFWKAVHYDPRSAHFWMDLAAAYEESGDDARAREAYLRAKAVYPASAEVGFYYGNFLLREQAYPDAYAELRRAVATDPTLLPLAISRTWRSSEDVDELLNNVLPVNQQAYLEALDFFASIHEVEPGLAVWQRLVALGKGLPILRINSFFDELIREDRGDDARRVWHEALVVAGLPVDEPANGNRVFNGSFKRDFLDEGLDWRWIELPDAEFEFDAEPGPNGSRAVRVDFNGGTNLALDEPKQYVPVEPGRSYHFHAYMRTGGITTESGVRFSLTDPNHAGGVNLQTVDFTGSRAWTAVESDLTTGPDTHFLLVQLFRSPSRLFENKLEGTVWIADVSVLPLDSPARPATP